MIIWRKKGKSGAMEETKENRGERWEDKDGVWVCRQEPWSEG